MENLRVKSFGPIKEANIEFGDFTLLVGPQASGKSFFLQLYKLVKDKNIIVKSLQLYGYIWKDNNDFFELFFGEGVRNVWTDNTEISLNKMSINKSFFHSSEQQDYDDLSVVYVPAQRVLTLQNGWPKPFSDFSNDPYVLKSFSDLIRLYADLKGSNQLDKDELYRAIFYDAEVVIDKSNLRKRLVLNINNLTLPYMMWSAGQKEFMPLWLCLGMFKLPAQTTIIIEEPEMGLHPQAIKALIVHMLQLMSLGYKIVVSTHAPIFMEFIWAIKILKTNNANRKALYELFDLKQDDILDEIFESVLKSKVFNTYYFEKSTVGSVTKDISSLDASSEDPAIAEWGGLSSFATRASEIVAKNVAL